MTARGDETDCVALNLHVAEARGGIAETFE
jgi:hypothetical protein